MTTHSLEISWIDTLADAISHAKRQLAVFFSGLDQAPPATGVLHDDIVALPDHLLRDIGLEPHQFPSPSSEFRSQVDASGFRQSAFTVDAHDMRGILAVRLHAQG